MKKICTVYYHPVSKLTFHRVVIWPDESVTMTKVRINPITGDERTLKTFKPRALKQPAAGGEGR